VVQDTQFIKLKSGAEVGKFCHSFRTKLCRTHLGLDPEQARFSDAPGSFTADVDDLALESVYRSVLRSVALRNTNLYNEAFPAMESNAVNTLAELKRLRDVQAALDTNPAQITKRKALLERVLGTLLLFPLDFLCEEDLRPNLSEGAGMLKVFTNEVFT